MLVVCVIVSYRQCYVRIEWTAEKPGYVGGLCYCVIQTVLCED